MSHSVPQILESLVALRPNLAKDLTVIIDAGIATEDNIACLKAIPRAKSSRKVDTLNSGFLKDRFFFG
jgi:hypothetical protein